MRYFALLLPLFFGAILLPLSKAGEVDLRFAKRLFQVPLP